MESSRKNMGEGSSEIRGLERERERLPLIELEKRNKLEEVVENQQAFMLALTDSFLEKSRELELARVQIRPQRKRAMGRCEENSAGHTEFQGKIDETLKFDIPGLKRERERLPSELEKLTELDEFLENQQASMSALYESIHEKYRELKLARVRMRPERKLARRNCEENPTGLTDQLVEFDNLCQWLHLVMASNMGLKKSDKLFSRLRAEKLLHGEDVRRAGPQHVLLAAYLYGMGFSMEEWDVSLLRKDSRNPIPQEDQDASAAGAKTLRSQSSLSNKQMDLFNHIKSLLAHGSRR